jgi:hypothetical protein
MAEEPVLAERRGSRSVEDAHRGDKQDPDLDDAEEEPRLKYQRLGCDVAELLGNNAATCLCVSDKILALGTHNGTVHVLDYIGNEVGRGLVMFSYTLSCLAQLQLRLSDVREKWTRPKY